MAISVESRTTSRKTALPNRTDRAMALALGVMVSVICVAYVTRFIEWGDDFALYLTQARAVSSGSLEQELAYNLRIRALNDVAVGPPAAPWGYPIILSLVAQFVGWNLVNLKVIGVVSVGAIAALTFLLARRYVGRLTSACAAILLVAQPALVEGVDGLGTDLPFLAVAAATLLLAERFALADASTSRPRWVLLIAGALLSVTGYSIRSNGAFLPVALFASLAVAWYRDAGSTRRRLSVEMFILTVLTGIAVLVYTTVLPDGSLAHASYLTFEFSSVQRRFIEVVSSFAEFMPFLALRRLRVLDGTTGAILMMMTLALAAFGAWRHRAHVAAMVVFFSLNAALLLLFPFNGGARYAFPLLLVLVILVCAALADLLAATSTSPFGRRRSSALRLVGASVPALTIAGMVALFLVMSRRTPGYATSGPLTPVSDSLFRYVRDSIPADVPVSFFKPRALHFFTGRMGVAITRAENADRAPYVILNKREEDARWQANWQADRATLQAFPDGAFVPVYESSQFVVLRRSRR